MTAMSAIPKGFFFENPQPALQSRKLMATSTAPAGLPVIRAAGGIVLRSTPRGEEVMIVFRKRHQHWTLPKGKLHEGESFQEAALREVAEETGCFCRLGDYLGTISYSHEGTPKVVMFWRMSVSEERPLAPGDEIAEAAWTPLAEAIQRLTYAQEKSLLSRLAGATKPVPVPAPAEAAQVATARPVPSPVPAVGRRQRRLSLTLEDQRTRARLLREAQAFRVELAFLERRNQQPDRSWAQAAAGQLDNATRCLESNDTNDIEGGLLCLQAARRYALFGLNRAELITRAEVLREEAGTLPSWRAQAVRNLLAVPDEQLTAERMAEAMAVHDEETTNQHYKTRLAGDQLRMLLMICGLGALALAPFMLLEGQARLVAPVLLFGLLGSCFSAAHVLTHSRERASAGSKTIPIPENFFVMVTPVAFGAIAGLAGYAIYQYLIAGFSPGPQHTGALLALAFLFGFLGERVLARIAGTAKGQPPSHSSSK
jgi:8-oxo-dGTP pyrophosphatase MutT (NUDIX family)